MKYVLKMMGIFALFLCVGCAWIGKGGNPGTPRPVKAQEPLRAVFVEEGKIIDAEAIRKGGKLLIVPFTAGVDVAATAELDKTALMLVKGAAEWIKKEGPQFQVLDNANAQEADFILKGHIVDFRKTSSLKRVLFQGQKSILGVEGQMLDASSKDTVLIFKHHKKSGAKEKDYPRLGYAAGQDIARFLLSGR